MFQEQRYIFPNPDKPESAMRNVESELLVPIV